MSSLTGLFFMMKTFSTNILSLTGLKPGIPKSCKDFGLSLLYENNDKCQESSSPVRTEYW